MPARRTIRRPGPARPSALGRHSKILQPGVSFDDGVEARVSFHSGVYQKDRDFHDHSVRSSDGSWKKKQRLANQEEGVLYTVKVAQRAPVTQKTSGENDEDAPPPQADTPNVQPIPTEPQQFTISKMHKRNDSWFNRLCRSFGIELSGHENVDSHLYKPSKPLSGYINWTFYASFTAVFISFLVIFIVLSLFFAGFIALAGAIQPDCIVVSGNDYGGDHKFGDAFALSWTTFTTVGYGNVYPATGMDYDVADAKRCSGVVFLCTLEAFLGLIYAGMCAAILFGKVNRVQSHAHLAFANAVCLQYEEVDMNQFVDDDSSDSDCDIILEKDDEEDTSDEKRVKFAMATGEKDDKEDSSDERRVTFPMEIGEAEMKEKSFREQFKGCPVLKFQVVNDLCNKAGGEIIDGMMKVIGIKLKRCEGKITHSQYVRVQLVDCEHPFFSRVWHGVHILDESSPLLTNTAKQKIKANGGSWPNEWVDQPHKIRRKLDFHSLVVTVSGISNVSASTVHAYKRYKFEDIIIGFDFAPLVYEDEDKHAGKLEVDLGLVDDVREQRKGHGEELKSGTSLINGASNHSKTDFYRGTSSIFTKSMTN
mmetsp:Transcript_7881/g.17750  ORF Transcript_7881/g.17750 Transcript_7881/m.17750 type:complete len:592 (+) Transcript_7881:47-1822(+)